MNRHVCIAWHMRVVVFASQHVLKGHGTSVTALAALPDGTLVSGDGVGTIMFWRDGRCVGNVRDTTANGHQGKIHYLLVHHCPSGGRGGNGGGDGGVGGGGGGFVDNSNFGHDGDNDGKKRSGAVCLVG